MSAMELCAILKVHGARYPLMAPADGVKLIFQNEFGGGHLISDPQAALRFLRREYATVCHDPSLPLTEDIGNGVLRVNLAALDQALLPLERLNALFVRSAEEHRGTQVRFLQKLALLRERTEAGELPFSPAELETYLAEYAAAGYPAVSHSERYRRAYAPAYRVVLREALASIL